ncbi:conserved exported hypothetical protein [Tenacibaculum litopenaei]|uniref:hypothetical protein n=1 Tax=Tenacibaculum litopenaei TaxID=396016 RepID=UPI0038947ABB
MERVLKLLIGLCLVSLFCACDTMKSASYDAYAHKQTIAIKTSSEELIDKGVYSYESYETEVRALMNKIDSLMVYEQHKKHQKISLSMWKVLIDKDRNLLGGYLGRWKSKGKLPAVFVAEAKVQIMAAFDALIAYEAQKDARSKEGVLQLILN